MEIEAEKAENMMKTTQPYQTQTTVEEFNDISDYKSKQSQVSNIEDPNNDLLKIDFVDTNNKINIDQI